MARLHQRDDRRRCFPRDQISARCHESGAAQRVDRGNVADLVTGVSVIGSHDLLETDSPIEVSGAQFLNVTDHILAKGRSLFRPVHIRVARPF